LPSTLNSRSTGFGFGNKEILSLDKRNNAKYNPPPDKYINCEFKLHNHLGKSFGIPHEFYKK